MAVALVLSLAPFFFIVSFKETANSGSLIQLALQFLNVETRFPMLAEGSTSGSSLPLFLGITMVRVVFRCFFGFQLEAKCVSKNDYFPY